MGGLCTRQPVLAGRLADRTSARPLRLFAVVEMLIGLCAVAAPPALCARARLLRRRSPRRFADSPISSACSFVVPFAGAHPADLADGGDAAARDEVVADAAATRLGIARRRCCMRRTPPAPSLGALAAGFFLDPASRASQRSIPARRRRSTPSSARRPSLFSRVTERADAVPDRRLPRRPPTADADGPPSPSRAPRAGGFRPSPGSPRSASRSSGSAPWRSRLGPSSYAFTLMLATVLAGIALGSYARSRPFMRRRVGLAAGPRPRADRRRRSWRCARFTGCAARRARPTWLLSRCLPDSIGVHRPRPPRPASRAILPTAVLLRPRLSDRPAAVGRRRSR